jgi:hypothetical protein
MPSRVSTHAFANVGWDRLRRVAQLGAVDQSKLPVADELVGFIRHRSCNLENAKPSHAENLRVFAPTFSTIITHLLPISRILNHFTKFFTPYFTSFFTTYFTSSHNVKSSVKKAVKRNVKKDVIKASPHGRPDRAALSAAVGPGVPSPHDQDAAAQPSPRPRFAA